MGRPKHHIVLIPGLFGFARLGGFDYFMHVEEALANRFLDRGADCEFVLVSSPPTGSIVYRTQVLMDAIQESCADDAGAIHLVGHSTGGLDARLLASPTAWPELPAWSDRLRTVVSISCPHYGTPLAHSFATLAGTRLLHALSLLTYVTLKFGGPPVTILAPVIASLARVDESVGLDIHALDPLRRVGSRTVARTSFVSHDLDAAISRPSPGSRASGDMICRPPRSSCLGFSRHAYCNQGSVVRPLLLSEGGSHACSSDLFHRCPRGISGFGRFLRWR